MGFYYFDYTYFVYMLPALLISMYAQFRVNSAFNQYSRVGNIRNVTGAQAAQQVVRFGNAGLVEVQHVAGNLTDHFDPRTNTINLSDQVYGSATIASVGVAAHEAGHAVQYAVGYFPIRLRAALVPVTRLGSTLSIPLIFIGLLLPLQYDFVVSLGIALYSLAVLFSLVTLPVEFNASFRAVKALEESGILYPEELEGAKKVLRAAAMTYVAATFTSLMSLLRILALAGNRRGNR